MKIKCGNEKCSKRRPHHGSIKDTRPHQMIRVQDDFVGKAFCSITCACLAGYYSVTKGWIRDPRTGEPYVKMHKYQCWSYGADKQGHRFLAFDLDCEFSKWGRRKLPDDAELMYEIESPDWETSLGVHLERILADVC